MALSKEMKHHYCFQIHRNKPGGNERFQLRIGMDWGNAVEFIPAHQTAFGKRLELKAGHAMETDVQLELDRLREWIDGRAA